MMNGGDMYQITKRNFHETEYGTEAYLSNWPMVYILENGIEAYIGESTNVKDRMSQHKTNEAKLRFDTAHFIYSKEFNQSVTFDYESKLIQLIAADEQYILTNGNGGLADKKYYNKEYYDTCFQTLWNKLRSKKIVKHTIDEIVNSDMFKYSPYKELNESQREAVEEIFKSVQENQEQPIIVNGMPGSGKTIVAVFLFKALRDYTDETMNQPFKEKKMALVIPQTSLRTTIQEIFRNTYGLKTSDVIGPSDVAKHEYDIVLVDEAHRLHRRKNITNYRAHDDNNKRLGLDKDATELDWILQQVKCPILFFDYDQVVGPSGIDKEILSERLNAKFNQRMVTYYTLMTQMRVKGGNDYIEYVKNLLNNKVKEKKTFGTYTFAMVNDFSRFEQILQEKEREYQLARMVAGYAWPWVSKKDKTKKDICIEETERMWNNRTKNWVHCENAINEVGCIHSIQGYDLNYAFVILGNDIGFDKKQNLICIRPEFYFDKKGKATANEMELLGYIRNIYYVLLTRGIEGTYVYVCDPDLRTHLSSYIPVIV